MSEIIFVNQANKHAQYSVGALFIGKVQKNLQIFS